MTDWLESEKLGRMLESNASAVDDDLGQLVGLGFEIGRVLSGRRVQRRQREDISRRIETLLDSPWWRKEIRKLQEDRERQAVAAGGVVAAIAVGVIVFSLLRKKSA